MAGGEEKTKWTRIGVAFKNRDGSLNVQLNYLPIDGRFQIREITAPDEPEQHNDKMLGEDPPSFPEEWNTGTI